MLAADTSPDVRAMQIERRRRLTSQQRWDRTAQRSVMAAQRKREAISRRHPEYSEQEVRWAFRRWHLGDELFRGVWPEAPIVAP